MWKRDRVGRGGGKTRPKTSLKERPLKVKVAERWESYMPVLPAA
jgi:hypothetical protein